MANVMGIFSDYVLRRICVQNYDQQTAFFAVDQAVVCGRFLLRLEFGITVKNEMDERKANFVADWREDQRN